MILKHMCNASLALSVGMIDCFGVEAENSGSGCLNQSAC